MLLVVERGLSPSAILNIDDAENYVLERKKSKAKLQLTSARTRSALAASGWAIQGYSRNAALLDSDGALEVASKQQGVCWEYSGSSSNQSQAFQC
jgi:hypothetical protein